MDSADNFFLTIFLSAVVVGSLLYLWPSADLEGFSEAEDVRVQDSRLVFSTQCFVLDMYVSDSQAEDLDMALTRFETGLETERPLMPELTGDIMDASDVSLDRVEVHSIQNQSFRADILLTNGERIDARPSDAVLLAAESDSPVYLSNSLLRDEGENTCLDSARSV